MRSRIFEFLAEPSPAARARWYESHPGARRAARARADGQHPRRPIIAGLRAPPRGTAGAVRALAADRLREAAASTPTPELLDAQHVASVHFMEATQRVASDTCACSISARPGWNGCMPIRSA